MSRLFRGVERRFTSWKNGGGETAEILCQPEGAGFDDFDWRISTAKVSQSGPFSAFPGIDRVLTVLEGGAMRLSFETGESVTCHPDGQPHRFSGAVPCHADLLGAPLLDLNLMVHAPLKGLVYQSGEEVADDGLVAAYLFALEDHRARGLIRHDLLELPLATTNVPEGTLVSTIYRGA